MLSDVTKRFDDTIKDVFKTKPEIMNFLLKHERKSTCINNLCDQILKVENYNFHLNVDTYDKLIKDIARFFAKTALEKTEQDNYSVIKKIQIQREADHLKEAELMLQDLEKETLNEKGLTQIERDEIKEAIRTRKANEVQA